MKLILDNIRSMYNVGSAFRTADAFNIEEIICTGYTPTPAHPELAKTALGAETTVKWSQVDDIRRAISSLKADGYTVAAVEVGGTDLKTYTPPTKLAVIMGNETEGISQEILALADVTLGIPMRGKKESLNVSVTAGIVMYALTSK